MTLALLAAEPPTWTAFGITLVAVIVVVVVSRRLLLKRRDGLAAEGRIARQLVVFGLCSLGALAVALALPLEQGLRGQVVSLGGLVLTAIVGLGTTTLFSNAMAGFMLRSMHGFRPGDFIDVEGRLGRVTERGLFHTEIQTEHRDLVVFPNLWLATRPMQVIRASGTMVSGEVSLGYDVAHGRVEELLGKAARDAGLDEPFVRVMRLGDYSVTYRVAGFLAEVKHLVSVRSRLNAAMLDALHGGGVEIVSPAFMNQRVLDPNTPVVPEGARRVRAGSQATEQGPEAIIFDKAEQAEELEGLRAELAAKKKELAAATSAAAKGDGDERAAAEQRAQQLSAEVERLEARLTAGQRAQDEER